jgi:hypothetical protein
VHLQSVAARFGLTPTEIAEIEEECIRDQAKWLTIKDEANWRAHVGREFRGEQEETSGVEPETREGKPEVAGEAREDRAARERTTKQDVHNTTPPPIEYTHDTMHDTAYHDSDIIIPFEHRDEPDDGAVHTEPDRDAIEPPEHELVFPMDTEGDWAEDWDEGMRFDIQGEYMPANYSPAPPPTSL